jgi:hypothetical protein
MKTLPTAALLTSLFLLARPTPSPGAEALTNAVGYWEGAITLPNTSLSIRVDLARDTAGRGRGTIDIPVQGLRGYPLTNVVMRAGEVGFAMPGIPGNPEFSGKLAGNLQSITGDFAQGGQKFPFRMERKATRPARPAETPSQGMPGKGLAGVWQGSLRVGLVELRLLLKVSPAGDGRYTGTMNSLDQGALDLPLDTVTWTEGKVHLEVKKIGGLYDGQVSDDGSEITGQWRQGGQNLALVFKRLAKAPEVRRPQDPQEPFPYDEDAVVYASASGGARLAGTLTLPRSPGPFPAVVLISGSGPQDRDEAIMGHRPFRVLADYLTRQGLAVLRSDDRGVGESTGNFAQATLDDFVEDALAGVGYLCQRREIDRRRIGLLGHSEGGIVAPLAVLRSTNIAFLVLLAGVGVPVEELLFRQGADLARVMGAGEERIAELAASQRRIFQIVKEESDPAVAATRVRAEAARQVNGLTAEQQQALGLSDGMIDSQIKLMLSPWFSHLLRHDPRPALRQVKCPVLALNGEKDLQVAAQDNLAGIAEALRAGGNTRFRTVELPGLNHLLQTCQTGAVAEYAQIEETMAPAALELIAGWIGQVTREPPATGHTGDSARALGNR